MIKEGEISRSLQYKMGMLIAHPSGHHQSLPGPGFRSSPPPPRQWTPFPAVVNLLAVKKEETDACEDLVAVRVIMTFDGSVVSIGPEVDGLEMHVECRDRWYGLDGFILPLAQTVFPIDGSTL